MFVNVNGTIMWKNKDGTLDELPVKVNPKVEKWFGRNIIKPTTQQSLDGGKDE